MEQQTLSADSETTTDPVSSPHQQRVCLCLCVCVRARVKELVCASLPSPYMMRCSIRVHRWLPLAPVTYCMQAALHSRDRRGSALLELLLTKFLFYFIFWLVYFSFFSVGWQETYSRNVKSSLPDSRSNQTNRHFITWCYFGVFLFCFVSWPTTHFGLKWSKLLQKFLQRAYLQWQVMWLAQANRFWRMCSVQGNLLILWFFAAAVETIDLFSQGLTS